MQGRNSIIASRQSPVDGYPQHLPLQASNTQSPALILRKDHALPVIHARLSAAYVRDESRIPTGDLRRQIRTHVLTQGGTAS